jgi:hypothetical protein
LSLSTITLNRMPGLSPITIRAPGNHPVCVFPVFQNWQARRASNPQPSVLETDTLPIELLA